MNKNWGEIRKNIGKRTREERRYVVGGDFNARIGELGEG